MSWMRPGTLSGSALLYVAGRKGGLYVFTYPQGELVGEVGVPYATNSGDLCSDANGDIFVPDVDEGLWSLPTAGRNRLQRWRRRWELRATGLFGRPKTGNLAVTNFQGYPGHGNVAVYATPRATRRITQIYRCPSLPSTNICGYDNHRQSFYRWLCTGH